MNPHLQDVVVSSRAARVDAAVHCQWADPAELAAYLPTEWRAYMATPAVAAAAGVTAAQIIPSDPYGDPLGSYLRGATPPTGGPPGSEPDTVADQVLVGGVTKGVLAFDRAAQIPALVNHYLGLQIIQAANNWLIDRWLSSATPGFFGLALVPNQLPAQAVAEIRRIGDHPRIAGLLMGGNGAGKPFGHPIYHPIYAEAEALDLPVVITTGGDESPDSLTHPSAGGLPLTSGERRALVADSTMTHLVSLVGQGVFEKFPGLRVLLIGAGPLWVASLLWRFDIEWKGLRREAPWVKRAPSEYVRDHIRIGTNPIPQRVDADRLRGLLAAYDDMADLLCYASGYPRRDADSVTRLEEVLPAEWHDRVFRSNAESLFRFSGRGR